MEVARTSRPLPGRISVRHPWAVHVHNRSHGHAAGPADEDVETAGGEAAQMFVAPPPGPDRGVGRRQRGDHRGPRSTTSFCFHHELALQLWSAPRCSRCGGAACGGRGTCSARLGGLHPLKLTRFDAACGAASERVGGLPLANTGGRASTAGQPPATARVPGADGTGAIPSASPSCGTRSPWVREAGGVPTGRVARRGEPGPAPRGVRTQVCARQLPPTAAGGSRCAAYAAREVGVRGSNR